MANQNPEFARSARDYARVPDWSGTRDDPVADLGSRVNVIADGLYPAAVNSDQPNRVLSVVMPCFNEEATVKSIIDRVLESPLVGEVIAVDDASTDATLELLRGYSDERLRVFAQSVNCGK